MDWFTWLSKTSLEPSLIYEYGLAFADNELEEEDINYFNHEFLQSMGISIAKHRLEILKLAKKSHKNTNTKHQGGLKHPISKFLLVLKKTKKSLTNYMANLVHKGNGRALVVVPNKNKKNKGSGVISYSSRWRRAMMMRNNKKLNLVNNRNNINNNENHLMLTYGEYLGDDSMVGSSPKVDSFYSPVYDVHQSNKEKNCVDDHEEGYWTPVLEEIRWDAMFQDLKPT